MKIIIKFIIILLTLCTTLHAECKIYKGKYTSYSNQVATFDNGKIFRGKTNSYSNQIGIIEEGKIYKGKNTSYSNQVGIIEDGKIYKGKYTSYSNQIGIVDGGDACASAGAAFLFLLWVWLES